MNIYKREIISFASDNRLIVAGELQKLIERLNSYSDPQPCSFQIEFIVSRIDEPLTGAQEG